MGQRSLFSNVMLLVIAVILLVGFYLTIGAVDIFRLREEKLVTEVSGLRSELARLRETIERGGFSAAPANAADTGERKRARFANEDLRDPNAADGDALVMVTQSGTASLNYFINNEYLAAVLTGMANDSLAERNAKDPNIFEPKLAEDWEISQDKLTYTIRLRKGILWHDFTDPTTGDRFENVEVTADDFKFFLEIIRNPKIPCEPSRVYYRDLQEIKVLDKYNFQVIWKEPYFMSESLTLGLSPVPRHFYRFDPEKADVEFVENFERNRMIVGCGPWIFEKWEKGKQISFRRNPDYYAPKPHLKRVVIKIVKEPTARLQALLNGEIDGIGHLGSDVLEDQWVNQMNHEDFLARFNKFKYPRRSYVYVGYNLRRELFQDRKVRIALTHLVDRERIVKEVWLGLARIVTGNFFIESPYYDHSIKPYPFDRARAKELLAEAGWRDTDGDSVLDKDGARFEFTFMAIAGSKRFGRITEIMREDFAKAGIVMHINPVEWSVYTQRLNEWNFDVCGLGWSMGWESDPYQIWHSSQADLKDSSNHIGFKNAEADHIIETARREFDLQKRIKLYHRFHQIMHEEQPYTFLVTSHELIAQDKRFRNARVYPLGMDFNTFWVPPAEQKYRD